jgi:hypothetical protein
VEAVACPGTGWKRCTVSSSDRANRCESRESRESRGHERRCKVAKSIVLFRGCGRAVYCIRCTSTRVFRHSGIGIGTVVSVSCLMHDKSACRLLIAHDPRGRGSFGVRLGLVR